MAETLIHVVRHAHAGEASEWMLDDDLRPLSPRGCLQAAGLAQQWSDPPAAIHSSPSIRCIATVLPLAQKHGLNLVTNAELYEGQGAAAMLAMLTSARRHPVVACTHGDILIDMLGILARSGVVLPSLRAEKGSTWTLTVAAGRVSSTRYVPPP